MITKACLATVVLGFSLLGHAAPDPHVHDTIALAIDYLEANGYASPEDWAVVEIPEGSNGDVPAHTDLDSQTIEIDVAGILTTLSDHGDASPDAVVRALAMYVRHELLHTPEYGVATPDPGGFGNSLCEHLQIAEDDMEYYCEVLADGALDEQTVDALCSHRRALANELNTYTALRNQKCLGVPYAVVGECAACE